MLIGILSDTHGRSDITRAAVHSLSAAGAEFFIHCGDVGGAEVLDELAGLKAAFVFGNNDYDSEPLQRHADVLGLTCLGVHGELQLGGKRIAIIHGHDLRLRQRILSHDRPDYLLQGHTHQRADQRIDSTRLINPGALTRARIKTVATLETTTDQLSYLEIADLSSGQ